MQIDSFMEKLIYISLCIGGVRSRLMKADNNDVSERSKGFGM